MPVPIKTLSKAKENNQWILSPLWRIFLLCALIVCSTALFSSYRQTRAASAATSLAPQQQAEAGQPPVQTAKSTNRLANVPSIWPVTGTVTSGFGQRNSPFGDGNEFHPGIDLAANMGAPVVATADGLVVQSGWSGGYGNMVEIDHGNGLTTIYGHNSRLAVSVGQTVKKGQVISYVGSTGKSTGPHVHYEVRESGTAVNPWKYLVSF